MTSVSKSQSEVSAELKATVEEIFVELGVVYECAPRETQRWVFREVCNMLPRRLEQPEVWSDFTVFEVQEVLRVLRTRHANDAAVKHA